MRVFLINPPADNGVKQVREGRCMQRAGAWTAIWTPISLAYCAAVLRKEGVEVKLVDCIVDETDFDGLEKDVEDFKPDLAVLNVITPSFLSDLSTVQSIKKVNPEIKTAVIGIHGTALPDVCFNEDALLDFVVRGEPEYVVCSLASAIKNRTNFSEVDGISYKEDGKIIHNRDSMPVANLDDLPFPAYDLINQEKYTMPFTNKKFLLVATGRGCPYPCIYCADHVYYGKKMRLRSPEHLVDELSFYKKEYGIEDFLFWSEGFTLIPSVAKSFVQEIISRNLKIRWVCNSRVDNVDKELLLLFKKAGCTAIGYGVESGVQEILDKVKKGITLNQIREAVVLTKDVGIDVVAHTIIGLPGDSHETINETVNFLIDLDVDFTQFYCAVPFPGSPLFKEATEKGWINTGDWRMFEQNFSVLDMPGMSAVEIMKIREQAYRKFYFRPKTIFKTLKRIRSFKELIKLKSMIGDFLKWF